MLEIQENNKLIKFIMGLNEGNEQMKSNLLGTDPLLPVNKAYNLVLQVEKHKLITCEMNLGGDMSALNVGRHAKV